MRNRELLQRTEGEGERTVSNQLHRPLPESNLRETLAEESTVAQREQRFTFDMVINSEPPLLHTNEAREL